MEKIFIIEDDSRIRDELMSINLGADDFITKPYNLQILLARIASALKRIYVNGQANFLRYREIIYNIAASQVEFNNKIRLSLLKT